MFAGAEVTVGMVCVGKSKAKAFIEADASKLLCRIIINVTYDEASWQKFFTKLEPDSAAEGTALDSFTLKDPSLTQSHLCTVV